MDPLSVTASVIAVTTLAWQSCKTAYDLVDGLAEAPQAIATSRASLVETQKTLGALQQTLTTTSRPASALDSVLRTIELDGTLKSAQSLCDEFATAIRSFTGHHESKINKFNRELGDCQRTISMVLVSINLIATTRTASDVSRLGDRFQAQEQALADLETELRDHQISPASEEDSASDRDASMQLTSELRKVCQQALSATRAKRIVQKFGDANVERSKVFDGTVGEPPIDLNQSFGNLTARNSTAGRGYMSEAAFAAMFGSSNSSGGVG